MVRASRMAEPTSIFDPSFLVQRWERIGGYFELVCDEQGLVCEARPKMPVPAPYPEGTIKFSRGLRHPMAQRGIIGLLVERKPPWGCS